MALYGEVLNRPAPEAGVGLDLDMTHFEAQFAPVGTMEARRWNAEARFHYLTSLPAEGFTTEQHAQLIDEVVAIGFPVNNFRSLHRRPNVGEERNTLGSWWGIGSPSRGEYSVYDLIDRVVPEKRLGTNAHESMHANTPFLAENAYLYGGEAERTEAAEHVLAVTDQSLATNIHLNGYHKWLMGQHRLFKATRGRKGIDYAIFAEETSAIMAEMALTDRNGLRIVEERQQLEVQDQNRIRRTEGNSEQPFVPLLSFEGKAGSILAGVDRTLVKLLDGINNHADLVAHVHKLKAMLYPVSSFATVKKREAYRESTINERTFVPAAVAAYLQGRLLRRKRLSLDEEDDLEDITTLDLALT